MVECGILDVSSYAPLTATDFWVSHRKGCKERKAQPQFRTRMKRIVRIFTDNFNPRASAQSAFHHVCSSLKNPASGTKVSAFITPKPCGFSTPRTRMPAGIRGHALQRRDSGRYHLRFFKNVIFQTGSTGYVFNPVHPVITVKFEVPTFSAPAERDDEGGGG
ncbi:MAG: hypothetical protein WAW23_02190 [Candidatus Methanoperedens sp.]